jgi:hypothetical protein
MVTLAFIISKNQNEAYEHDDDDKTHIPGIPSIPLPTDYTDEIEQTVKTMLLIKSRQTDMNLFNEITNKNVFQLPKYLPLTLTLGLMSDRGDKNEQSNIILMSGQGDEVIAVFLLIICRTTTALPKLLS